MKRRVTGLLAAAALAGCSAGPGDDPKAIKGAPKQVADAVTRLETATRRRQFEAICGELFSRAARERAGGRDCPSLLRSTAGDVRRPRIHLLSISIDGERAGARVRTTAASQGPVDETIRLVREGGRYRIQSLAP